MKTLTKLLKRTRGVCLVMLSSIAAPLLIWAAIIVAFRQMLAEWRNTRAGLLAGNLICNLDTECPPGYQCVEGRCLPVASQ